MPQTRRQTEPLRNKISSPWGNVPSMTRAMMLLDPTDCKSNLCMREHQLRSDLKVAERFFFGTVMVSLHSQIEAVVCSLWVRNTTAMPQEGWVHLTLLVRCLLVAGESPLHSQGKAIPLPGEQEWISCLTVPCKDHGVKILCSSVRPLQLSAVWSHHYMDSL